MAFGEGKAVIFFVVIKSYFPELKNQNSFLVPIIAAPNLLPLACDFS